MGIDRAGQASRGSQYWIQCYVNDRPLEVNRAISEAGGPTDAEKTEWVSPLRSDAYSEYYDQDFLDLLGVETPHRRLDDFWPARGPHWDALGKTPGGELLLVEAKSHIPELFSNPSGAGEASLARIRSALDETAAAFNARPGCDWTQTFYQYANRLAHLYFLRDQNGIPAWLVFVAFLNDEEMKGPVTRAEWEAALTVVHHALGLRGAPLMKHVLHVFLPAAKQERQHA